MKNELYNALIDLLDQIVPQSVGNIPTQLSLLILVIITIYFWYSIFQFIYALIYGIYRSIRTYCNIKKHIPNITYKQYLKAASKVRRLEETKENYIYYELSCDEQENRKEGE